MISGERQNAVRWQCGVCGRGVGRNIVQCTGCQKWVHEKCGSISSMSKVMKSFICRGCLNLVISAGCTSLDIGASAKLELLSKFCYLGDADASVDARVRIAWNKFRHLVPLLTNKDASLIMRGRLCSSCVQNSICMGV